MRQDASKRPQEAPRSPKRLQEIPKRGPRRPQEAPRTPQYAPKPPHVDSTLESILNPPEVLINWRGGTKAQPSTIRRPSRVGVLNRTHGFSESFLLSSFWILLLGGSCLPLLNPPPVASGRLPPLRRFAALAPLGGSWAEKIAFQEAFKN